MRWTGKNVNNRGAANARGDVKTQGGSGPVLDQAVDCRASEADTILLAALPWFVDAPMETSQKFERMETSRLLSSGGRKCVSGISGFVHGMECVEAWRDGLLAKERRKRHP